MGFDLAAQANHAYSISISTFGLGHAYLRQGRIADAIHLGARLRANQTEQHRSGIRSGGKPTGLRIRSAGRSEEARALGQIEVAHFSFLSSTHFLLAAIGIGSDRVELTLCQARKCHQSASLRGERGTVRIGLGAIARRAGRENEARSEIRSALTMAEDMGIESAPAKARGYLQLPP